MLSREELQQWFAAMFGRRNDRSKFSSRTREIRESNIRDAARLVAELSRNKNVVNLGQGLPEYLAPQILKDAAKAAIDADFNQYSNTWGYPELRVAIAGKLRRYNGIIANPESQITVTCGASEALHASLQAIVDPGDEVIVIEPFYENYHPDIMMAGGVPRYIRLKAPDYALDETELARAFNRRTRVIMINNPHNPTGRVFTRAELEAVARLCQRWNVVAICDEIYEHLIYDGRMHISLATVAGMEDRTITISGLSKTFSVTGWRLGYMTAPEDYTREIRKLHDYMTLAAPSPLQIAAITAMNMPEDFYAEMVGKYQAMRDRLAAAATTAGFKFRAPEGAYYLFTDSTHLGFKNDREAWNYLLNDFGLVTVAGYCFYRPNVNTNNLRFCFAKRPETIDAGARLLKQAGERRAEFRPKSGKG